MSTFREQIDSDIRNAMYIAQCGSAYQECARAIEIAFLAASILRPKDEPCDSGKARSVLKNAMAETHSASWLTKIEKQVIMTCLIHAGNMLADVAKEQWIRLAEQIKDQAIKKEIER